MKPFFKYLIILNHFVLKSAYLGCEAGVETPDSNLDFDLSEAKMTLVSKFGSKMTPD